MNQEKTTTLPISKEELMKLIKAIEDDFGYDYGIDAGLAALTKLRELVK